jgi:glycosyltransferase involved in cell wall biosynthesis
MKIGVIARSDSSNAYYRGILPVLALGQRGHEIVLAKIDADGQFALRSLLDCDVVHVFRCHDRPPVLKSVEQLRRHGVAITWDHDDDVRLVPPDTPGYKQNYSGFTAERTLRGQAAMLSKADVVTTTTQVLADMRRADFDGPIEVIENYIGSDQYVRGRRNHDGVVIGWIASMEHLADVRMLELTPMLRNVMARDERIRVTTAGVKLDLDPERYVYIRKVQFHSLAAHIAEFDIGIAPLGDHPMSYARSNIKLKEYAAAGVPWVASPRGPYADLGAKAGGITVADDRWEQALLDLAGSRLKRMRLRRNAESWAKGQHIDRHVGRWEAVMEMAVEQVGRRAA